VPPVRLIVNPAAGGGKAARVAPAAERALRERGVEVRSERTRDLDHARALAHEAAAAGEAAVAVSGDGLLGALADALREHPGAVLGLIPGGRGNDLARVLGIPDDPAGAAAIVADGHTRAMDLGLVEEVSGAAPPRAFVGIASVGFDSDANRIANEAPPWLGGLVYAYGALRALASWRHAGFDVELEPPGEHRAFTGFSVGAANSRAYGGGMRAAPAAMLDDGMLDVVALGAIGKARFLTRILPRVFKGTHVEEPEVTMLRAREIALSADRPFTMYADGDPIGDLPVRVRALPGAVQMLVPRGGGEAFAAAGPEGASAARHTEG
jgi:YegS/Rv2252/BmrU family lipid kinase